MQIITPADATGRYDWRRSDFWYDGSGSFFIALTVGSDPAHPGLLRLGASCRANRIPLRVLGAGRPWRGGNMAERPGGGYKVNLLGHALYGLREALPEVFANLVVLFTDGYDACALAPVEEILDRYAAFGRQIVFSTEIHCWPDAAWARYYPMAPDGSPFRYLNSGGFIGPATDLLDLICSQAVADEADDQRHFTGHFLNPRVTDTHGGIALDYRCAIFQTLNGVAAEDLEFSASRVRNRRFGTDPCLVHANGMGRRVTPLDTLVFERPDLSASRPPRSPREIGRIVVINLERRAEKRSRMELQLAACLRDRPEVPVEFFPAVDGRELTPARLAELGARPDPDWVNPYDNQPLSPGELGCALSHHAVWASVRDGAHPNVLVLEDDVEVPSDLLTQLDARMGELGDPWDFAYLDRNPRRGGEHRLGPHALAPRYSYWSNAYVLNRAGARKLLATDYLEYLIPVDEYLPLMYRSHFDARRLKHYRDFPPLLAVAFDPSLVRPTTGAFKASDTAAPPVEAAGLPRQEPERATATPAAAPAPAPPGAPRVNVYVPKLWEELYLPPAMSLGQWELTTDELFDNVFQFPMLTPRACRELIELAEAHGAWETTRHRNYPTTDLLVSTIGFHDIMTSLLKDYVHPLVQAMTRWERSHAKLAHETFIARYLPDAQSHLALHHDASAYSVVVGLNDGYEGGGTWFSKAGRLVKPPVGTAVLHPGAFSCRHGARPITAGVRYMLVSFVTV